MSIDVTSDSFCTGELLCRYKSLGGCGQGVKFQFHLERGGTSSQAGVVPFGLSVRDMFSAMVGL